MGELLALAALGLYSLSIFVTRAATASLEQQTGFFLALITNVVLSGALAGVLVLSEGVSDGNRGMAILAFVGAGMITSYAGRRLLFLSIDRMGPSRASAFQVSSPAIAALGGVVFFYELPPPVDVLAIAAVIVGLFLASTAEPKSGGCRESETLPRAPSFSVARASTGVPDAAIGLGSAAAYALGQVLRASAIRDWNEAIIGAFLGAIGGLLIYSLAELGPLRAIRGSMAANSSGRRLWILNGVLTIIAQAALIASVRHTTVARASVIVSATPAVVVPVSVLLLKERANIRVSNVVGILTVVGGVIVLVGR